MSKISATETKPERLLRSALHRRGYRFRKNVKALPGTPDVVLKKFQTAIFVNGCFWHQHPGCPKAVLPKSNSVYWISKFKRNMERDAENRKLLSESGWQVLEIWECEISCDLERVLDKIKGVLIQ